MRSFGTCITLSIVFALRVLIFPSAQAQTYEAPSAEDLYRVLSPSIYLVESYNKAGHLIATGSAVSLKTDAVVTNCHVIQSAARLVLKQGSRKWPATVFHRDEKHDLCELQSLSLDAKPVQIRDGSDLKAGERVYAIGAPRGLEATLSEGIISGLRQLSDGTLIQTTAAISPGSSGGGLFDFQGALIGVTTFGYRNSQNLNFALPSGWIVALDPSLQAHSRVLGRSAPQADSVESPSESGQAFEVAMRGAAEAFNATDYDKATTLYTLALEMRPDNVAALWLLGQLYANRGQSGKAQPLCERAVSIDPKSANAWSCLGDAYSDNGRPALAIEAYKRSVSLDPENAANWLGLGTVLGAEGDRKGALDVYEHLKQLDMDAATLFYKEVVSKLAAVPAGNALPEH